MLPDYGGASLTNLPATIGALLGADAPWRGSPLPLPITGGVKRVVLLLLDGLGHALLQRLTRGADAQLLELLGRYGGTGGALPAPITSVSPSTTAVATSVVHGNGASPGELGLLGYTQLLPRLGVVGNMLFFRPAYDLRGAPGSLEGWGLKPEELVTVPSAYQLLARAGVRSISLMPSYIAGSPLSRVNFRGANVKGYVNWTDMLVQLKAHLEEGTSAPSYAFAYVPDLDTLMHRDGPSSASVPPLFHAIVLELKGLLEGLTPAAREGTLFLITADHGHYSTPLRERRLLDDYPELLNLMGLREAGEPRHTYLYARRGAAEELYGAAREALGDEFVVLRGEEALADGLYGDPRHHHPETPLRVGDVVLLARRGATLWSRDTLGTPLGMHGSLTKEEMLVPLLPLRADA